jgi:hypothetical protein
MVAHELGVRVEAGRRHGAAEHVLRALQGTRVSDDANVTLLFQHRHQRIGVADGIDLARAQRRQRAGGSIDAHIAHLAGLDAGAREHQVRDHVRRRFRCGNAYPPAAQVCDGAVAGDRPGGHAQGNLRRPAHHDDGLDPLVPGLHVDGVLVGAAHHVGRPTHQGLQRPGAARDIRDLDIQPLGLEVTELFRDGEGEIVEGGLAAHGDRDPAFLRLALRAHRSRRDRRRARSDQQREAPPVHSCPGHFSDPFSSSSLDDEG